MLKRVLAVVAGMALLWSAPGCGRRLRIFPGQDDHLYRGDRPRRRLRHLRPPDRALSAEISARFARVGAQCAGRRPHRRREHDLCAKPDGLTIGMFNTGLIYDQLIKRDGVMFDLTKFSWIGKAADDTRALMLSKTRRLQEHRRFHQGERRRSSSPPPAWARPPITTPRSSPTRCI